MAVFLITLPSNLIVLCALQCQDFGGRCNVVVQSKAILDELPYHSSLVYKNNIQKSCVLLHVMK